MQRLSVERLTPAARAFKFSRHDAPGEAVKHKAEKPLGFVLDSDPSAGKTRKLSYFDAENEENLSFWLKAIEQVAERRLQAVTLHVYDILGPGQHAGDNGTVELRGTGAFHLGLEVAGLEWSYGYAESGTGVFQYSPLGCEAHSYRGVVELGYTQLDAEEALARVRSLQEAWKGTDYDPLRHSCCDFVTAACDALGAARPPTWVRDLGAAGATLTGGCLLPRDKAHGTAVIAAAQANQVAERFARQSAPADSTPATASNFL